MTLQTKMDGFPQEISEKPEPAVIPFPCTGNLSLGQKEKKCQDRNIYGMIT